VFWQVLARFPGSGQILGILGILAPGPDLGPLGPQDLDPSWLRSGSDLRSGWRSGWRSGPRARSGSSEVAQLALIWLRSEPYG